MANVSLRNISGVSPRRNGEPQAVIDGLNLEVQDREFLVLLGPPGSGPSTVVRIVAGLDGISQGEIFVGDRRINDLAPKDREVAMVPNNYVPYPRMSLHNHLAFGLKQRKFSNTEIEKRVRDAAQVLGLGELLKQKPESLSGEQRQRLAIARAAALQPKVLLFDQPLAEVEPNVRPQLRKEIVQLHQRLQRTMIYATRDSIEAMAMGTRVAVMHNGIVQQIGTARKLYSDPDNVFVAEFLGTSMNLIQGNLKQDRDWLLFSEVDQGTIELRLPVAEYPAAQAFAGKPVRLGVRPEQIAVSESKAERYSGAFPAIIDFVEPISGGTNLTAQTGAHRLSCQITRQLDPGEAGHRLQLQIIPGKVCLFDPISGLRVR
jgi:multiple sugar transport system ATP-binding protein